MKKKILTILSILTLSLASSLTVFASPETMPDGGMFDAEYYAQNNPDVVQVFGTDKNLLYSHYVNCGKAEGRLPYDESQLDFTTKAMQKLSFNPREFIDINNVPVTIDELRADTRPHASTYSLRAKPYDANESSSYEVMKLDVFDIPMANYIYCCEFDKYVAEKALLGFTLDPSKTSIEIDYGHYMHLLTDVRTGITKDTEIAIYNIMGNLAFTTKEGLTVYRYMSLHNDIDEGLYVSKDKEGTDREIRVYKMRDYNGKHVMDAVECDYMTYLDFAQLMSEGKVKMYTGESYGIAYGNLGGYSVINKNVVNIPVYVE